MCVCEPGLVKVKRKSTLKSSGILAKTMPQILRPLNFYRIFDET